MTSEYTASEKARLKFCVLYGWLSEKCAAGAGESPEADDIRELMETLYDEQDPAWRDMEDSIRDLFVPPDGPDVPPGMRPDAGEGG